MFTGVLTFKKTSGGFYRVIMPDLKKASHPHIAYIRYAKEDLLPSTLKPPLPIPTPPFECCGISQEAVELVNEKITVEGATGQISSLGKVGESLVRLKELAEGDDFNVDAYDQNSPGPLVAVQMDLPNGILEAKRDQGDFEWYFETSDHIKSAEPPRCLAQGVLLKLTNLSGNTVTLTATKDRSGPIRKLNLKLGDHGPTLVTIGNSLPADVFCRGLSSGDVDEHFEYQYRMLRNPDTDKKYLPKRDKQKKCKPMLAGIESVNSIGGSDCLGSQWP